MANLINFKLHRSWKKLANRLSRQKAQDLWEYLGNGAFWDDDGCSGGGLFIVFNKNKAFYLAEKFVLSERSDYK